MIESKLTLFDKQVEVLFGNSVVFSEYPFCLIPEVLDAIYSGVCADIPVTKGLKKFDSCGGFNLRQNAGSVGCSGYQHACQPRPAKDRSSEVRVIPRDDLTYQVRGVRFGFHIAFAQHANRHAFDSKVIKFSHRHFIFRIEHRSRANATSGSRRLQPIIISIFPRRINNCPFKGTIL
jgi:hypothetical protein